MRNAAREPRGENLRERVTKGETERARNRERNFSSATQAVEETTRDVIVPLRTPTWSTNQHYGTVMDMEMHSRDVTVPSRRPPRRNRGHGMVLFGKL